MTNTFDTAVLGRSTIGFERLFDLLNANGEAGEPYPPYNIEKAGEDRYRIALAVAGFSEAELAITQESNLLTVQGTKAAEGGHGKFLHRGISARPFVRRFNLADYVRVQNAKLVNGLLTIELERQVPEAMRPRQIAIGAAAALQQQHAA